MSNVEGSLLERNLSQVLHGLLCSVGDSEKQLVAQVCIQRIELQGGMLSDFQAHQQQRGVAC